MISKWAYRGNHDVVKQQKSVEERIQAFRDAKRRGLVPRRPAKSSYTNDAKRKTEFEECRRERAQIRASAAYDSNDSRDVTAQTSGEIFAVDVGDVLSDRTKRYKYPWALKETVRF